MKTRINRVALLVLAALVVGLGAGYFFSGLSTRSEAPTEAAHTHQEGVSYTCSMHPQINQPEPGSCPICGMALIPAQTDNDSSGLSNVVALSATAQALAQIQTEIIDASAPLKTEQLLSGTVEVNQALKKIQTAQFDGRIEQLFVASDGQYLQKGQELAKVYSASVLEAQQELLTAAKFKKEQPDWYEAVRNKLRFMKFSERWIDEVELNEQPKAYFSIYAESSATVLRVNVKEGDYIAAGKPLFDLADLSSVWFTFDAYEQQIERFELGQPMRISVDALPEAEFDAKISFIDPVLNEQSRITRIRAEVQNNQGLLKPGMFVKASIDVSSAHSNETLIVRASAVLWTGERSVVYVQPEENLPNYELRTIKIGRKLDTGYEVLSGLQPGDRVVTDGAFVIDASAQLKGLGSMMNDQQGKSATSRHQHQQSVSLTAYSITENQNIASVLPDYLALKSALVASDALSVARYANKALRQLNGDSEGLELIKTGFERIAAADALPLQRAVFIELSERFIAWASQGQSANETLYVQFCPMADNNQGARWLSTEEEIRNPYYGDAMLKCGSVVQVLSL